MSERHPQSDLDQDSKLMDSPLRACSFAMPIEVSDHLDDLVGRARGSNTSRRELAAAIIAHINLSGIELNELVIRYRTSSPLDLPIQPPETL